MVCLSVLQRTQIVQRSVAVRGRRVCRRWSQADHDALPARIVVPGSGSASGTEHTVIEIHRRPCCAPPTISPIQAGVTSSRTPALPASSSRRDTPAPATPTTHLLSISVSPRHAITQMIQVLLVNEHCWLGSSLFELYSSSVFPSSEARYLVHSQTCYARSRDASLYHSDAF